MTDLKVALGFYTGEYAGMLRAALHAVMVPGSRVWYRTEDRMTYTDGYEAALRANGHATGPLDPAANSWAFYVGGHIRQGPYLCVGTTPFDAWQEAFYIHAPSTRLTEVAIRYAKAVHDAIPSVGGDDDTFDYFPDAVEALYQLCRCIGTSKAEAVYQHVVDEATRDNHLAPWVEAKEIVFPAWEQEEVIRP